MPKGVYKRKKFSLEHKMKIKKTLQLYYKNIYAKSECKTCCKLFTYNKNRSKGYYCCKKCFLSNKYSGFLLKGDKMLEETKEKLSLVKIGKKTSIKTRILMSETHKKIRYKNNFWKGGLSSEKMLIRKCCKYKIWRMEVFKRDNFKCVHCLTKKSPFNADHIKSFASIIKENNIDTFEKSLECEELWDINNGRTLCIPCHKKTDTYGNKKIKI